MIEGGDRLEHMFKESLITTKLSRPQELLSDQSTSQPCLKMDKIKAKMSEYEGDHFDGNESTHSLDSEFSGFDVTIMRTHVVKQAIATANKKLCSTCEKNHVSLFKDNNYMEYHYAFMMKVTVV